MERNLAWLTICVCQAICLLTPTGAALISATVLGDNKQTIEVKPPAVKSELRQWFGTQVDNWKHLKTYHIAHALPSAEQIPPQPTLLQISRRNLSMW